MLIGAAVALSYHAWKIIRIVDTKSSIQQMLNPNDLILWLDLQIKSTKQKIKALEPGPPPSRFYPSYYFDWLPRAKLYEKTQETLFELQKQKREIIEKGRLRAVQAGKTWNIGIAPVLHILLAISLLPLSLRLFLRMVLVRGSFGWVKL